MASQCLKWGQQTREECAEYRDEGYNACSKYQDQGYNACENWNSECCDWWPCSWACEVVSWFCVAWYWVTNLVCVAWYWVANVVCVAWTYIVETVCLIWGVFVGIVKELWNLITDIIWRIVGVVDFIGGLIGIRPFKKLRLTVMLLRDEKENLVVDRSAVIDGINRMIEIYRDVARVNVILKGRSSEDWIIELTKEESSGILDVSCGGNAILEDFSTQGQKFSWLEATKDPWGNFGRLFGYGCPITVFIVRSMVGAIGCSLNILSNYVCVVGPGNNDNTTIAHECGHSCGLWDLSGPATNLMCNTATASPIDLTDFQIVVLRDSKHITYL